MIARRRKGPRPRPSPARTTAGELLKAYKANAQRKRDIVLLAESRADRLRLIVDALSRLQEDPVFLAMAELDGLGAVPQALATRLSWWGRARS